MLDAVDPHRKKFGLKTFAELRAPDGGEKENLLIQQKTETVDALSKIAQPCNGVPEVRPAPCVRCSGRQVFWLCGIKYCDGRRLFVFRFRTVDACFEISSYSTRPACGLHVHPPSHTCM